MKYFICGFVFSMICNFQGIAQIDANSLLVIPSATTAERKGITGVQEGAIVYDTDENRLFEFTDTGWVEMLTSRNVFTGVFRITTAGVVTITDVPFRPTSITLVAHANVEDFTINADNGSTNNDRGIRNSFGTMNGFARDDGGAIAQQCIYVGGHGNSINDISRFASNTQAIGVRYGDQNGNSLGIITGAVTAFTANGFTLNVTYTNGTITNAAQNVLPTDINNEGLVVLYTAYR
ncbi:hypothetical protein ACFSTE_17975 [Aquimarina hainanensis]|uniref:Uncharacterized protein n=1 Tax=Aquimarina hainanensis TaxID=1578017 RepID=A0ABW5NAU8_9FLAO